jgi:protein-disulfide isomerase
MRMDLNPHISVTNCETNFRMSMQKSKSAPGRGVSFRALRVTVLSIAILAFLSFLPDASLAQVADAPANAQAAPAECGFTPYISRTGHYAELVSESDPVVGDFDAPVTVIEYFDPNCGHCRTMHPIMKKVIETYQDRVRFFMIPYVLWPYSLGQIEALYVSAAKGKYYEMLDAQFNVQQPGGLSIDELSDLAESIGIDPDWLKSRVAEGRHQQEIIARRGQIRELGVTGTPTIMINGRYITDSASKTAECIGHLIEEALNTQ